MAKKNTERVRPTLRQLKELQAHIAKLEATVSKQSTELAEVEGLAYADGHQISRQGMALVIARGLIGEVLATQSVPADFRLRLQRFAEISPVASASRVTERFANQQRVNTVTAADAQGN